jgi:hypothetical protein
MTLIPDDLKKQWKDTAEKLNAVSGGLGVRCQLIFSESIESTSSVVVDNTGTKPRTMLSYGGRSPARSITGRDTTDETAESGEGLKEKLTTKNFEGRVYAVDKAFERFNLGVQDGKNAFELVTKKSLVPFLRRAKEAVFNLDFPEKRMRVRMIRPPAPYGLGQAVQCKSIWEEV